MTARTHVTAEGGITLIEVVLAVVICAAGLVVAAQGVALALKAENHADRLERGARLGERLLAQVESGEVDLTPAEGTFPEAPGYAWTLATKTGTVEGLTEATVTVTWEERNTERTFFVTRLFFQDPEAGGADVGQ